MRKTLPQPSDELRPKVPVTPRKAVIVEDDEVVEEIPKAQVVTEDEIPKAIPVKE